MRDNSKDRTVERNYIQKWRFLVREYELVKAKCHPQFRFVQDFYAFHDTSRQTFAKYYTTTDTGSQVQIMVCCP